MLMRTTCGLALGLFVFRIVFCFRVQPTVINEKTSGGCPASVAGARANASQMVQTILQNNLTIPECGPGNWVQVASLNVSDTDQSCPLPWILETGPGRSCAIANSPACGSVYFDTLGVVYQNVCGMALGYATNTPDAFLNRDVGIDGPYLDGVSITYGMPRQHIWSLALGHGDQFGPENIRCPCDNNNSAAAPLPPAFVGENYFCDTNHINQPVWDGICTNTSACCTFNNPPWFVANLPAPASDNIETRICHDQGAGDERVFVSVLSLFVQ